MVQLNLCTPIPIDCCTMINHVAFDGCDYFGTIRCKCEIIRFSPSSCALQRYDTCREYDCICYDYKEHCFWASSRTCRGNIFKLDCSMNEIDYIHICHSEQYGTITGISYNCCKNTLMVSFIGTVLEIEKCSEKSKTVYTAKDSCIIGLLSICPCILLTVIRSGKCYIAVIDQCGKTVGCHCVDFPSYPVNLIFNPCTSGCHQSSIWAFILKKNCYPYLCRTDISFNDLGFIPYCCNYEICKECCCDKNPCPDHDSCSDVLESIALMETSLSHILNAEGEKIQKVLATTDDIDKILCVNREVNKTIVNATHLEHTLYAKLSALSDCECGCNLPEDDCGCHDCCHEAEIQQSHHIFSNDA